MKILALALVLVAVPLSAQNLVVNGGFESGTLSSWTQGGSCSSFGDASTPPGYTGVVGPGATGYATAPEEGSYQLWFGATDCLPSISQTLSTSLGQSYNLSFWTKLSTYTVNNPNVFAVTFGGNSVFTPPSTTGITDAVWTQHSFTVTGTGGDEALVISANNPNGGTQFDDVSVTATPEPSSMALLGTGLIGLVPMVRRRLKK